MTIKFTRAAPVLLLALSEISIASSYLDEVVVTGRRDGQSAMTLTGQVGRLSADELTEIGHAHIQEAAVRIPGVWLSRGDGQELLASVRSPVYTGPGSCGETLVAEDGLPTRPSGLCNVNQLFEVNAEQASGFEVWRGAGSVFYGSNAMHGVINSLSPKVESNYAALELGPHDYKRIKVGVHSVQGAHSWQVAANGNSNGSFKDDSGFDQQKVSIKHGFSEEDFEAQSHLSLTNLNQETATYVKEGREAYEHGSWNNNDSPEAYRDAQSLRLSSRLTWQNNDGDSWSLTPYLRSSEMEFMQHYLPVLAVEKNGQDSFGLNGIFETMLSTELSLWMGIDFEWANMWVKERQDEVDGGFGALRYQGQHYDFEVTSNLLAAFANVEWNLSDTTTVEAGVRFEHIQYDYDNNMLAGDTRDDGSACAAPGCRYYRPADRSDRFNNPSFHVGFTHQLTDTWVVYSRVASAYRAPQINERYRLLADNPDLSQFEEKTLKSLEAGVRYGGEKLALEVSAYGMRKKDVIIKASDNDTVGDGESSHSGLELGLSYGFNQQWLLQVAAAWAEHQVDKASDLNGASVNGNEFDTAPEWQGSSQLKYSLSESTSIELEWVYMGDYYIDAENDNTYDGHSLFNLRVHTELNQDWSANIRLKNIADQRYAERADFSFGSYRYFVGGGRSLYVELQREF
jgi:outer membrane receptor protein involved in Fe transport